MEGWVLVKNDLIYVLFLKREQKKIFLALQEVGSDRKNRAGVSALSTGKFLRVTTKQPVKSGQSFRIVWKVFWTVWKVLGQSGRFPVSKLSEKFPKNRESFWTDWKVSGK